jgi:hypothetical protein
VIAFVKFIALVQQCHQQGYHLPNLSAMDMQWCDGHSGHFS